MKIDWNNRPPEYYRAWRMKRISRGLTSTGQPRKRVFRNTKGLSKREANRVYYLAAKERRHALGLNARGYPFVFKHIVTAEEKRERQAQYMRTRRARFALMGLTAQGKPRKYGIKSPLELAWRQFRATLDVPKPKDWSSLVAFEQRAA